MSMQVSAHHLFKRKEFNLTGEFYHFVTIFTLP